VYSEPMIPGARYVHTNLVARDWRRLAAFYTGVFGCEPVPPERDLAGRWLEECTAVPGARIRGVHLRLPGVSGPTLEIFEYDQKLEKLPAVSNREGFGHIAFHVPDVDSARREVMAAGGRELGQLVITEVPGVGLLTVVYVTDPEGNIIELQTRRKTKPEGRPDE
jgi:catechol 2,3-dioxygenase-like lactoylglutathione lyase family enzyme